MKKRNKRKLKVAKFLFLIIFIVFSIFIVKKIDFIDEHSNNLHEISFSKNTGYDIIKQEKNDNYIRRGSKRGFR